MYEAFIFVLLWSFFKSACETERCKKIPILRKTLIKILPGNKLGLRNILHRDIKKALIKYDCLRSLFIQFVKFEDRVRVFIRFIHH